MILVADSANMDFVTRAWHLLKRCWAASTTALRAAENSLAAASAGSPFRRH